MTKVPLGGGTTTILAKDQASPASVAVGDTSVYWANYIIGGAVMKVAKP